MRYMNPGYVSMLDDNVTATQFTNSNYSKTGVSFVQTNNDSGITLENFSDTDDFWAKLDFFIPDSISGYYRQFYLFAPCVRKTGLYIAYYPTANSNIYFYINNSIYTKAEAKVSDLESMMGIKKGTINSLLLHVKYGDSATAYIEATINNKHFSTDGYNINYSTNYAKKVVLYEDSDIPISNVIISNEEISIKEQIVALPITSIQSDMTYDSETGIYTATAANQSLLASVNVAELINNFGSDSKVTGVAMVGNPAYRTAEGLSSLTSISMKNNSVTEYGAVNIPTDSDSVVAHSFKVATDTTIADLQSMQLGWKVGG